MTAKRYQIDFVKASDLPNADLYFRMMVAMNDLISIKQLSEMIKTCELDQSNIKGLDSYTSRMLQSHIAEACNTFVDDVRTKKDQSESPFFKAIQADAEAAQCFSALMQEIFELDMAGKVTLRTDTKGKKHHMKDQYEQLKAVRDCLGFHYNPESTQYIAALAAYKKECQAKPHVKLVGLSIGAKNELRFPIGDSLAITGSMLVAGIADIGKEIDEQNKEYVEYRDYVGNLLRLLLTYLATTVRNWLHREKLLTRYPIN